MNTPFWLDIITGEVLDQRQKSLAEFRRRTPSWQDRLVMISEELFERLQSSPPPPEPTGGWTSIRLHQSTRGWLVTLKKNRTESIETALLRLFKKRKA